MNIGTRRRLWRQSPWRPCLFALVVGLVACQRPSPRSIPVGEGIEAECSPAQKEAGCSAPWTRIEAEFGSVEVPCGWRAYVKSAMDPQPRELPMFWLLPDTGVMIVVLPFARGAMDEAALKEWLGRLNVLSEPSEVAPKIRSFNVDDGSVHCSTRAANDEISVACGLWPDGPPWDHLAVVYAVGLPPEKFGVVVDLETLVAIAASARGAASPRTTP